MPVSAPRRRPAAPPPPGRPWRAWAAVALALALAAGAWYYARHRVQLNRYARRAWAGLTQRRLTGREKTPQLAGYAIHGIDVSAYQGRIDWPEVARHRVRFAFVKATEGATLRDPRFGRNWRQARAVGIRCGAYHYFRPNRDGRAQADNFAAAVPRRPGDLPPVLDVEAADFHDVAVMRREVARWLRLVEARYGVRPILYTNYGFYRRHLAGHFDDYALWLAHYEVPRPALPPARWLIWQHSDEAYVPGIRGTVDFNVFQGTEADLQALSIPAPAPARP